MKRKLFFVPIFSIQRPKKDVQSDAVGSIGHKECPFIQCRLEKDYIFKTKKLQTAKSIAEVTWK